MVKGILPERGQTFTVMGLAVPHPAQHLGLPVTVLEPAPSPTGGRRKTAVAGPRQGLQAAKSLSQGSSNMAGRGTVCKAGCKPPSHTLWSHSTSLTKHKCKDKIMKDLKTTWPQNIKPQAQSPSEQGEGTVALVIPRRWVPRA